MRPLIRLFVAIVLGLLAYLATFILVVHRPLTRDEIGTYAEYKRQVVARTPSPRIVILAGSNGRFSHSCDEIMRVTGVNCANISTTASVGLRFQIDNVLPLLQPGDLVYMPIEYRNPRFYDGNFVGDEAAYLVHADPRRILTLYSPAGALNAFFGFDLRFLVSSGFEMVMARAGIERRTNLSTLNAFGDETGHDAGKARIYRDYVMTAPAEPLAPAAFQDRYWADVSDQIARLRSRRVIVVGGLPTIVDDQRGLDDRGIAFLRNLYERQGGCFVVLPNKSMYERVRFYDAIYHLQEPSQRAHSRDLAPYLARIMDRGCNSGSPQSNTLRQSRDPS